MITAPIMKGVFFMKTKSKYAQVFDSSCKGWEEDQKFNVMYLKAEQNYFNDILKNRGYVFLRDILECLGIPITQTSLFVGWYYDLSNASGDNYIDFDIHEKEDGSGIELDFNVDGDITNRFKD